ncbi:hypothetical protein FIU86_04390 [Roseovarius sp. THAF9]|uniref:hypothetical protein n=1 Tax=Roseovarius sp. THAF9 TaxID=2587847 RepID=UPI0012689C5A|nr:hypothetical protein [Roseovarius sp. THAF9]QFT92070.1 hypothetical protein FIU86_04390 [Roseovarius sp. THAF9]
MIASLSRIAAVALALSTTLWAVFEVFERTHENADRRAFRECVSLAVAGNLTTFSMKQHRERCAMQQRVNADYFGNHPPFSTGEIHLAAAYRPSVFR